MKIIRLAAVLVAAAPCFLAQIAPRLTYRVEVKDGDYSAFHLALEIDRPETDEIRLSVAAWAPGSYRLMKVSQNIRDVAAVDETGAARAVRQDGDLTWVVDGRRATRVTVTWRFTDPGHSPNNRTYLTETGGLLDGPRNYLYWRDKKELPAHVIFKLPQGWRIATGLTATFDPAVYHANDADWLLDCPVLMGRIETRTFHAGNVPHRVAFDNRGRPMEFDVAAFVDGVRRIVEATIDVWGFIPYPHYTFLYSAGGGGGLEHLTSTTIGASPRLLASNPNAHQGVTAHEFFHAWNVKRLRPKALGPFDYDGPVRTKSLWISEGITNYYTTVILARAGLIDDAGFLASFERTIGSFVANPASRIVSPEEASWTVWDGAYLGGAISYYEQGEVLGLLMDLAIRGQTRNVRSLDDAMRLLYRRFSGPVGFQSEDVVTTIRDATGVDLHAFFLRHVSGAREIDWQTYFRHMGCLARVTRRPRTAINLDIAQGGSDGVTVKVPEDSALFRLGLRDDDVVTAIGGVPVKSGRELLDAFRQLEVGVQAELTVKRGGATLALKGEIEGVTDVADLFGRRGGGTRMTVARLSPESALAASGLQNGDRVTGVNGVAVATRDEYRAACAKVRDGEAVKIAVERGGAGLVIEHRAQQAVNQTFDLVPDPAATPLELEIRGSLIHGAPRAAEKGESRPRRLAG